MIFLFVHGAVIAASLMITYLTLRSSSPWQDNGQRQRLVIGDDKNSTKKDIRPMKSYATKILPWRVCFNANSAKCLPV